jgi:predicted amidophosphoribosyltransferase
MALITCPDCRKEISDLAPSCPNCGRPIKPVPPALEDVNAKRFMGKPGTMTHTLNVGCAALVIGIILIIFFAFLMAIF